MSDKFLKQNIRISAHSWKLIRWAKFKLGTKTYSETIIKLNKSLGTDRDLLIKEDQKQFEENRLKISSKKPKNDEISSNKPKTIQLTKEAYDIVHYIKEFHHSDGYVFTDSILLLVRQNGKKFADLNLLPNHLK